MTRWTILTALILALTPLPARAQDEAPPEAPPEAHPEASAVTDAQISYALGYVVGLDLKRQGVNAIDDGERFVSGVRAALGQEEPAMTVAQIQVAMQAFVARMRAVVDANKQAGQAFLDANAQQEGVVATESGLQIKTLEEGQGAAPQPGDIVTVHYEGRLIDGTVFDQSQPDEPLVWDPRQFGVIPGWIEGLALMKEGGKYELYVPSDLAYGDRPNGDIPAGSTLIFTMQLIDTATAPEEPAEE